MNSETFFNANDRTKKVLLLGKVFHWQKKNNGQHCPPEPSQLKQDISEIFNKSDENELKLEDGAKKLIL